MTKFIPVGLLFVACLVVGQTGFPAESVESNDGTKIFYEVLGEGPTILLLHGLGGKRSNWSRAGFVDQLPNYRLILVDARGHGDSDGPGQPDGFAMKRFVDDLEAIVLKESDAPPIFWGFSMGAAVGFHIMFHKPTLFSHYILGDGMMGVYGNPPERRSTEVGAANVFRIQASRAFVGYKKYPNTMADFLELDRSGETEDLRNNLGIISMPAYIYRTGETQALVSQAEERTDFYIPDHFTNLEFHLYPELTHGDLMGRSELVVPRVLDYLEHSQN